MAFKSVFIAIFIGTALIVSALIINNSRPTIETGGAVGQSAAQFIRATGKCA
ncbi:MAG: hypothetical protein IH899_09735, partial [Planctomycetes bacterium]|nr:hypothetical protein [Planctomycetota bacterium]